MSDQLDFGKDIIDASLSGAEKAMNWFDSSNETELKRGELMRAQGGVLHKLHSLLKVKNASFGRLVRVQNKKREFLWVHKDYVSEY